MANNIVGGIAFIRIDGLQYKVRGNAKYSTAASERESVAGMDGVHGYKETVKVPFVEMDLSDSGSLELKSISAKTDITVTLELGSGKQFVLRNAWCVTAPELDATEGQFTVRFEGLSAEELLASGTN